MKKIIFLVMMTILCMSTFAQYNVGDRITIDGIPAVIIKLDDSHRHGLAMTMALDEKQKKGAIKKGMLSDEEAEAIQTLPPGKYKSGVGAKKPEVIMDGLVPLLTENGKENQKQIVQYCDDNGISLKESFPFQYWAQTLGDGWFIPGDQELTYFAEFYCGGLGKTHSLGQNSFYNRSKELCIDDYCQWIVGIASNLTFGMWSSSCHQAKLGFRRTITLWNKMSAKMWIELYDSTKTRTSTFAMCEF